MAGPNYRNEIYSPTLQLRNYGGLTLISREFFPFAKMLMEKIQKNLNEEEANKKHNLLYLVGNEEVHGDKELLNLFVQIVGKECKKEYVSNKIVTEMFHEIVEKTYQAKRKQLIFNITQKTCSRRVKDGADTLHRNKLKVLMTKSDVKQGEMLLGKKK